MDARPFLVLVARALREQGLEAVLIGNAGAAVQGAPVTTMDIDLFFRKTPSNIEKLKNVARSLGAVIFRPFYPVTGLYRLIRDDDDLRIDFMTSIHGVRSFNSIRSRATVVDFEGAQLWVASLADIIASKRAAGRPKDLGVMYVLEATLKRKTDQERDSGSSQERE
jgi:predicted nucleotidyltransferase